MHELRKPQQSAHHILDAAEDFVNLAYLGLVLQKHESIELGHLGQALSSDSKETLEHCAQQTVVVSGRTPSLVSLHTISPSHGCLKVPTSTTEEGGPKS